MCAEEFVVKVLSRSSFLSVNDQQALRGVLEETLAEYELRAATMALVPANDMKEKILLYLASKKLDGLSDKTLSGYYNDLVRFSNSIFKNIADITTMDIRAYLANLMKKRGLKMTTMETKKSILKSFFSWLEMEDYITKSPAKKIRPTKVEKRIRKALTDEELERLRDACRTTRQRALIEFLFSTGCRLSEISAVNIMELDWANGNLKVIGKGNKERIVYFSSKAKLYLKKYLAGRHDADPALFVSERKPHERLGNRAIEKEIAKIAVQAGFSGSVFPHLLRHTFATLGLKSGVPLPIIQDLMGHASASTTQVYAVNNKETVEYEYKKHMIQ